MAKRGRQKNRTGNSKRPPAPSLEGAAAAKLPSVNPEPLEANARLDREGTPSSSPPASGEAETTTSPARASVAPASVSSRPPASGPAPSEAPSDAAPPSDSAEAAAPVSEAPSSRSSEVEQVDEFEEAFFSSLPPEHLDLQAPDDEDDDDDRDARVIRLSEPAVVARRARMRKRVAWGLVACAAVFCFAMARLFLHTEPDPVAKERRAVEPAAVAVAAPSVAPAAPAVVPAAAAEPAASSVPVASAEPAPVAEPPPVIASAAPAIEPASAASAAPAASAPVVASGDAKELRKQARKLLESGKAKDAIPAALESTTLEPEHAEGWLLLGAAYQDRGRNAEARQAFVTCVAQAKRGPRGECAAMLR